MRWSSSPRAIAATPSASWRTGRVMRRATIAVARPPSTRATTASAASSRRVSAICGVHPPAREADPHGAPAAALDQDRHRDVVERLPVRPDRLLEHGRGREGAERHRVRQRRAHRPGRPAVRHDLAEPVEDHRVDHVGLAVEAHDVLLEGREVVEEERAGRHAGQALRQRRPAAVHLLDDGRPLPVLDDDRHGGHEHRDDQDGADEELGAERDEDRASHPTSDQRGRSSHTFRKGMYESPRPLTSTPLTYGWNRRSYVWCQTGITGASSRTISSARR